MAKIITRDQRIVTGVTYPKPVYSRVISCRLTMAAPFTYKFSYTPTVAMNAWLLGIDVWFRCAAETNEPIDWGLGVGVSVPTTYTGYANDFTSIVPVLERGQVFPWITFCRDSHYHWSLCKMFTDKPHHFGVWAFSGGPTVFYIYVSFEISEG